MALQADSARLTERAANNFALGQSGRTFTTDTTAIIAADNDCDFYGAIQMITDTEFTTLTDLSADGDSEVGVTFVAGDTIYGVITEYELASGSVRAYKVVNAAAGGE